jgi:hypothetical protein
MGAGGCNRAVSGARYVHCLALLLGPITCGLDDRTLLPSPSGTAGSGEAARGGAEDPGNGGEGGGSSGQPVGGDLVDGCADLDTDGVADCTVTLVHTPSFESDVSGWTASGDSELSWDAKNALSDSPSGSAKLSGRTAIAQATQCVPVDGRKLIVAYANAFVEAPEDAEGARASLEVSYFANDDCSDTPEGFFETPASNQLNAWTTIHAGSVSLPTTRAVSVTLVGVKAQGATKQSAYFDNVMLSARDL